MAYRSCRHNSGRIIDVLFASVSWRRAAAAAAATPIGARPRHTRGRLFSSSARAKRLFFPPHVPRARDADSWSISRARQSTEPRGAMPGDECDKSRYLPSCGACSGSSSLGGRSAGFTSLESGRPASSSGRGSYRRSVGRPPRDSRRGGRIGERPARVQKPVR
jgi:hypothetical protein